MASEFEEYEAWAKAMDMRRSERIIDSWAWNAWVAASRVAQLRNEEKFMSLYRATNEMMAVLGCHGTISARDDRVSAVMDALYDIDGGIPVTPNVAIEPRR